MNGPGDERWLLACIGALSVGLIVGLWSAGDSGDDMRKLIYRAELPTHCLQMLDRAEKKLLDEEQARFEVMEETTRPRF
jgi:hypothetical protein